MGPRKTANSALLDSFGSSVGGLTNDIGPPLSGEGPLCVLHSAWTSLAVPPKKLAATGKGVLRRMLSYTASCQFRPNICRFSLRTPAGQPCTGGVSGQIGESRSETLAQRIQEPRSRPKHAAIAVDPAGRCSGSQAGRGGAGGRGGRAE